MSHHHQFRLNWENHSNNLLNVFGRLFSNESFTDVTLAAQGRSIRAHKMVLSASSKYFEKLFLEHHMESTCSPGPMIVIMRDTSFEDLSCIIEFMYKGEINISRDQLGSLLKTAESLGVNGLAQATQEKNTNGDATTSMSEVSLSPTNLPSELQKSHNDRVKSSSRKRLRIRRNLEPANHPDDSGSPSDSQTSSTNFSPRIEKVVSVETPIKMTPVNNDSTPILANFANRITSPKFAASFEPILLECDPVLQDSPTFSNIECDPHPQVKQEQCICDFFRGFIVYKFNDYIAQCHGNRQQYWEEPFTQAVLKGIQDRELDMRKGAQLLGVSYSTLYGRYKYIQT
ncbi:hypothetical protein DAPPUDRAFT_299764 [Daphnia pulex]|uniref:BTB domain-containing protein n=1 Tax=Daphnia pulex TaxID=6669 RepID=E9H5G8_DAPPU|nr:hypothetical protein DAPPUDRAFT_299764 [Daphnia pulex]|eukprot:EFX73002.1 hypothetical protein DAPPUDRAFT_299764 [Daphnia pulex]